jgi:ankyrin repeat protein
LIGVCFKGNETLVRLLIDNGAHINAQNNLGTTPLIFATMYNKRTSVILLLEKGADKTITDNEGKTALDYASEKGFDEIVGLLE